MDDWRKELCIQNFVARKLVSENVYGRDRAKGNKDWAGHSVLARIWIFFKKGVIEIF